MLFFSHPLVFADSQLASVFSPALKNSTDHRHTLLTQQLENERLKLRILESKQSEVKSQIEKAKKILLENRFALKHMEVGSLKRDGPYYREMVASPITKEGVFYQEAKENEETARENLEALKREYNELAEAIVNQKRLILEKLARLKNFEQAETEHWKHNPF